MPGAAYWSRVLARLWVQNGEVRLTYIDRGGITKVWTGVLHAIGTNGPFIPWQGKQVRLCPWAKLISAEDAREVAP